MWMNSAVIACVCFTVAMAFPVRQTLLNEVADSIQDLGTDRARIEHHLRALRLQRHHKRRAEWLREALVYLHKFGYLESGVPLTPSYVAQSLAAFQRLAGVETSGRLDAATVRKMREPRCGNADIPSRAAQHNDENTPKIRSKRFAQVSKWLDKLDTNDVLRLTWHVEKYTQDIDREQIRSIVQSAFDLWSRQIELPSLRTVKLQFAESSSPEDADINILWDIGDHGDSYPFDDAGNRTNILAHTFYPNYQETGSLNGDIHFDDFERWVVDSSGARGVYFPYVLVHEIGHALGLGHSNRAVAVMNPIYKNQPLNLVQLDIDDRCAINWNYVGSTQMCLFVWLMVELLPRANHTSTDMHGLESAMLNSNGDPFNDVNSQQHLNSDAEIELKINRTLAALQNGSIPICRDGNNVELQYEVLLENHLQFPEETAQQYGPVVCNFLDGLALMVENKSPNRRVTREDSVGLLTAHAYPHRFSRETQHNADFVHMQHRRRRRRRRQSTLSTDVFNKQYFDEAFYKRLFTLVSV